MVAGIVLSLVVLFPTRIRLGKVADHTLAISSYAGTLVKSDDQFLDGSQSVFQTGGWHLDDGTKCWADTYGFKIGRFYWMAQVMHGRPEDCKP